MASSASLGEKNDDHLDIWHISMQQIHGEKSSFLWKFSEMTEFFEFFIKEGIPYILLKLPKCSSSSSRSSEMASWQPQVQKEPSSAGKQPVSPRKRQLPYEIAQIFVIFCVFYQNWVTSEESTMSLKPSLPTTWPFAGSVLCKFFQAKGVVQLLPSAPRWVQCWLATVQPASSCVESVGVFHFSRLFQGNRFVSSSFLFFCSFWFAKKTCLNFSLDFATSFHNTRISPTAASLFLKPKAIKRTKTHSCSSFLTKHWAM